MTPDELSKHTRNAKAAKAELEQLVQDSGIILGVCAADHGNLLDLIKMFNDAVREHAAKVFVEKEKLIQEYIKKGEKHES